MFGRCTLPTNSCMTPGIDTIIIAVASEYSVPVHLTRDQRRIRTWSRHDCNRPPVRPHTVRLLQVATAAGGRNSDTAGSAQRSSAAPRRGLNLRWVDRALFIWLYCCCCRFRILDSRVPMVQAAKDRMRNNVSEPLDWARVGSFPSET
jgi:hypothetical protein